MNRSMMSYEQEAMERQGMLSEINELKSKLAAMESDFVSCARGISACFFCENDSACECISDNGCVFKWKQHN